MQVVDGEVVQNIGYQNTNFGITKGGNYVVGYLNSTDVS